MIEPKSTEKSLMSKYLSWPVVCVLSALVVFIAYFQIPQDNGSHEGYLFTLAGYLAMSTTVFVGALLERSKPNVFAGGPALFYRFWLVCCSIGTVGFWLILSVFPVPVWSVKPNVLFLCYVLMFFGSLSISWLISRGTHSKTSVDSKQSIF